MMCCHMSKDLSSISYVFKPVGYFCVFHPLTTEPENVTMLNSPDPRLEHKGANICARTNWDIATYIV